MKIMTSATPRPSLHPLLWIAGISVTALALAGVAALTGLLPKYDSGAVAVPAAASTPAVAPPSSVPVPTAGAAQTAPAAAPAVSRTVQHKTVKRVAEGASGAVPPPAAAGAPPDYVPPAASVPPACRSCGVIENVREVTHEGQGTGLGAVAGGVIGGVLGNNVGQGNGRTLATIAGAVGGGLLGNKVEKSQRKTTSYEVTVRMEDGSSQLIDAATMPSWRVGDQVRLVNGAIVSR